MEKSNFDRLLNRYLTDQVSEQEKNKIEAWLDMLKTEDTTDLELTDAQEEELFRKITAKKDNIREITAFKPPSFNANKNSRASKWILRIAASLLIASLVTYGVWKINASDNDQFQMTSTVGVEKAILADGSLVWLRGKSKLVYNPKQEGGIRYAQLAGEGLFEVAKDAAHPFIVQCGSLKLKVVGTSFNIKSANDSLELKVLTGKVQVYLPGDEIGVTVEMNERLLYAGKGIIEKHSMKKSDITELSKNTEYDMHFSNINLATILLRLEDKFNVQISIANPQAGNCRITANLTDHSLENSLQIIKEVLDVNYTINGEKIQITGLGCK